MQPHQATATSSDHALARRLAHEAGQLLLAVRDEMMAAGAEPSAIKDAGDQRSNDFLMQALAAEIDVDDRILSEEARSTHDDTERLVARRVWIIDPLDGTREFSEEGRSDWAVHVALCIDGEPVCGAVALPAMGTVFSTADEVAALPPIPTTPRVVVSRTRPPAEAELVRAAIGGELVAMGSAGAKAMAIIGGEGDCYPHSGGQYEWDSAAPVAVAQHYGLHTSRLDGSGLVYNNADPYMPDLVVCRAELAEATMAALGTTTAEMRSASAATPRSTEPERENGPMAPSSPPTDLAIGSFSDHAPWIIDRADISWLAPLADTRRAIEAELPSLTQPSVVPPLRRMGTVVRHLGWAFGRWAIGKRRAGGSDSRADISRRLRIAAEALGPTYIKLAQIISSGEGLFPEELVAETKKCRDKVPPETWETVREIVETDLGRPISAVFSSFETKPLAAASIAQVHAAVLRTGEAVVVKVQRPTVAGRVRKDLKVMAWIAPKLVGRIPIAALANPPALVELFAETIAEELDFRLEAENMLDVAAAFAQLGQRDYVIPRPHPTLVTTRVLVMERLSGFAFDDVAGMKGAGVDTHQVVRTGMIGFMEGALIHGIFHGDLHGGNLFIQPDGRTALLDFGITGRLTDFKRVAFLRMLVTATSNDVKGQLAAFRDLGALPADTDLDAVIADLGLDRTEVFDPTAMDSDELVAQIQQTMKALMEYGARLPKELMLFVKNMMFIDGAIATLAPDLDILSEIATLSMHFAQTHGEEIARQIGGSVDHWEFDMEGVKAGFGLGDDVQQLTYNDLRKRREVIQKRLEGRRLR